MFWHADNNHDPWAPFDHVVDVDMVDNDLDIMDFSDDEHVRTASCTVVEMTTSVAKYDGLEDLEDHVVDHPASRSLDAQWISCTPTRTPTSTTQYGRDYKRTQNLP